MADKYDVLLCVPAGEGVPLRLPDNKIGVCAECGTTIQYRPINPPTVRRLCFDCGMSELSARSASGEPVEIGITEETQRLFQKWLAERRGKH